MGTCVAFLRAINVGGHTVTNDRLRALFTQLGLDGPTPYQASGNVVFGGDGEATDALETRIERHLRRELGYEVVTFVRHLARVAELAGTEPFGAPPAGARLHVGFVKAPVAAGTLAQLQALAGVDEHVTVSGRELLWQVPGGFADSALASPAFQRTLGQPTTLRTRTTLARIAARFG